MSKQAYAPQSWWVTVSRMGAECGVFSCTQADDKAQNNDGLEQGIRALLDDFFFPVASVSPLVSLGVHRKTGSGMCCPLYIFIL